MPILAIALAFCVAPLLVSAQAHGPGTAVRPHTEPTRSIAPDSPATQPSATRKTSLMGMVMAALIESAEQTDRQRREAAHPEASDVAPSQATGADAEPDPARDALREDAIRKQIAVQDVQDDPV